MSEADGWLWAYQISAEGRATAVESPSSAMAPEGGLLWIHLDATGAERWVREQSGLSELAADALLADETRPRSTPMDDGLLLILRGVNLHPGANPEDMVSIRIWAEARRVLTVRRRDLLASADLRNQVARGNAPTSCGEFLGDLADLLMERMEGVLGELNDRVDDIEERDAESGDAATQAELLQLRRQAILLRRYLAPQRDALGRLGTERLPWLGDRDRLAIREAHDRTLRYVEDLEAVRERAAVVQEERSNRIAEQMNRRMYALSIVAGIFLPLSFVTGLLGINVGGMPGVESSTAFAVVCVALVVLGVIEIFLFRKWNWL